MNGRERTGRRSGRYYSFNVTENPPAKKRHRLKIEAGPFSPCLNHAAAARHLTPIRRPSRRKGISMQYKTLGDTGLLVSTLCFGTMTFHGGTGLFRSTRVG